MFSILKKHSDFTKFGCRSIRRFRVLDGNLESLQNFDKSKLLEKARESENQIKEKLTQVLEGMTIFIIFFKFFYYSFLFYSFTSIIVCCTVFCCAFKNIFKILSFYYSFKMFSSTAKVTKSFKKHVKV